MTDHFVSPARMRQLLTIAVIRIGTGRRCDPQGLCPSVQGLSLSGAQAIGFRKARRRFVSTTMPVGLSAVFFALYPAVRFGFGLGGARGSTLGSGVCLASCLCLRALSKALAVAASASETTPAGLPSRSTRAAPASSLAKYLAILVYASRALLNSSSDSSPSSTRMS